MKKKLICTLMILVLCAGLLATGALADGGVTLSAAGAEGAPGDTVSVVVCITENPGIGALNLSVSYDSSVLEPVSYTISGLGGMSDSSTEAGTVTWGNTQNTTYADDFLTLSYKIKDTAVEGATAAVSVSGTADANTDDGEEVSIPLTGASATVTVKTAAEVPTEPTAPVAPVAPVEPTDEPTTPDEPDEPEEPAAEKPVENTNTGTNTNTNTNTSTKNKDDVPKTGESDYIMFALLAVLALGAAAAVTVVCVTRKNAVEK